MRNILSSLLRRLQSAAPNGTHRAAGIDVATNVLARVAEASEDAIIGHTIEGTILSWNRAAKRLYGYSAGEAVGRSLAMIASVAPDYFQELRAGMPVHSLELSGTEKGGAKINVSWSAFPITDSRGKTVQWVAIVRDITDRKRQEQTRLL